MAIMAVVVSDRDLDFRDFEPFALSAEKLDSLYSALELAKTTVVEEAVILSTCARTEVYVEAQEFHSTVETVSNIMAEQLEIPSDVFTRAARVHYAVGAAEHLYRVSCGLESRIIGESEILSQTKVAFEKALAMEMSGPTLNRLFQEAIEVGKWTRSETKLSSGSTSTASAAVKILRGYLEQVDRPRVAVVGTGSIGSEAIDILVDSGADVTVVSRNLVSSGNGERSSRCKFASLESLNAVLSDADGVIFATRSPVPLFGLSDYEFISRMRRSSRELVVVDLSLPRDVDIELHGSPGLSIIDLDGVNEIVEKNMSVRLDAVQEVEDRIEKFLSNFGTLTAAKELSPVIASMYMRAENIRVEELQEFIKGHPDLDSKAIGEIDKLTNHIVKRLLHTPTTRLRTVVNSGQSSHIVEDAKILFDL